MLDRQVTITGTTLLRLIHRTGAEPHAVLADDHVWRSDEVIAAHDRRVHAELAALGLSSGTEVDPEFLATVEAIARPRLEYYAWVAGGYGGKALNYTVLAGVGGNGESFVLGRNTDADAVVLANVPPDELMDIFITQLPELPSGNGQQVSAPRSQVTGEPGPAGDGELRVMRNRQPPRNNGPADEVKRIVGLPRLGGGSLYVAARNQAGSRRRAGTPVNYIDTEQGRWLTEQVPGQGEPLIVCTPADLRVFTDRLRRARAGIG